MLPLFVCKVFEGNSDHNTVVRHILNQPFITKQVTIRPKKVKGSTGLRIELYGCKLGKISLLFVCFFHCNIITCYRIKRKEYINYARFSLPVKMVWFTRHRKVHSVIFFCCALTAAVKIYFFQSVQLQIYIDCNGINVIGNFIAFSLTPYLYNPKVLF